MNNIWKNQLGINKWREKQILKRMSKITMQQKQQKKENLKWMQMKIIIKIIQSKLHLEIKQNPSKFLQENE